MSARIVTKPSPDELLEAALAGDQASFRVLVEPYVREIHVHCYRMLGSFHDAEDATQETLLRAWRFLHTFQERAPLRAWLYRIATTTCLKAIEARRRHRAAPGAGGADVPHLEPYPDRLLDELRAEGPDPAAAAEQPGEGDPASLHAGLAAARHRWPGRAAARRRHPAHAATAPALRRP